MVAQPFFSSDKTEASFHVTAHPRAKRDQEVVCECGR